MRDRELFDHVLRVNLCGDEIHKTIRQVAADAALPIVLEKKSNLESRRRKDVIIIDARDWYGDGTVEYLDLARLAGGILDADQSCRVVVSIIGVSWGHVYRTTASRDTSLVPENEVYEVERFEELLRTLDKNPPKGESK